MPSRSRLPRTKALWLCVVISTSLAVTGRAHGKDADPWFGRDKALHFGASSLIACSAYGASTLLTERTSFRIAAGAGVALSAGIAKEVYDKYSGGDASFRDLTWDAVGTATGLVLSWLIDRYLL
jgi:putative lipoprotein